MEMRCWMLMTVLASPMLAVAQDKPATDSTPTETPSRAETTADASTASSPADADARQAQIVRETATVLSYQSWTLPKTALAQPEELESTTPPVSGPRVRFELPRDRRPQCGAFDCIGYDVNGVTAFTHAYGPYDRRGVFGRAEFNARRLSAREVPLEWQVDEDLLPTFERYGLNECGGLSLGPPRKDCRDAVSATTRPGRN